MKRAYQSFNPQKKVLTRINKDSERTQLLWFISDAEEGLMHWIISLEYIYNIILTSEDSIIKAVTHVEIRFVMEYNQTLEQENMF